MAEKTLLNDAKAQMNAQNWTNVLEICMLCFSFPVFFLKLISRQTNFERKQEKLSSLLYGWDCVSFFIIFFFIHSNQKSKS